MMTEEEEDKGKGDTGWRREDEEEISSFDKRRVERKTYNPNKP